MRLLTVSAVLDAAGTEGVLRPRDDVVGERAVPPSTGQTARFTVEHGPFVRYERIVTVEPTAEAPATAAVVTQRFRYELPPGIWPFLVGPALKAARCAVPAPTVACPGGTHPSGPTPGARPCSACWRRSRSWSGTTAPCSARP